MAHPPTSDPGCTNPPLSQIICCKLCFSVYKSPKLLPCLHSFCCLCLSNHCDSNISQGRATVCPSCSEPFEVPEQGVANLPNNVVLQRAILSNVNQIKIKSPTHYRNRSVRNSNSLDFSDTSPGSDSRKYCLSKKSSTDSITAEVVFQREKSSENADSYQCGKATENDQACYDNCADKHGNGTSVCQSTQENVKSKLDDKKQTPNQSNLTSPSTETDASLFQQEHHTMVKSCSEFSNFSIGSLKFEPPQDYADCTEDPYIEDYTAVSSSVNHDPMIEEQKQRDRIKDELASFQTEALAIVYSIDNLNKEKDRWNQQKQNLHNRIQQRSARLQDLIKGWERQLLLQVEAHWHDINMVEVIEEYKCYMHNRLKGILAMTDLARMLLDHGLNEELPVFEEMIINRKQKLNGNKLSFEKPYMKLSIPADEDVIVENLFGSLNVMKKSESFWEFCPATQIPSAQSGTDEQMSNRSISEPLSDSILLQTDSPTTSKSFTKGKSAGSTLPCRSPSIEKLKAERLPTKRSRSSSARRSFSKQMSPSHSRSRQQPVESPNAEDVTIPGGLFPKPVLHGKSSVPHLNRRNSLGYQVSDQPVISPPCTPTKQSDGKTVDCTLDLSSGNRRNTEGTIQIDWERDFLNTRDTDTNRYSDSSRDTAVLNESGRRGHLDDDVQQTRRMLAMCKKQLLEAQTESNPLSQFSSQDVRTVSLPSSPRERFDHMKFSARKKSSKWRSESRGSISSLDGD